MYQLLWTEGILLGQQHLQLSQARDKKLLHEFYRVDLNEWGILDLQIDTDALSLGRVYIKRCVLILENKQEIYNDENLQKVAWQNLQIELNCDAKLKTVYLAIAINNNVSGISGYPSHDKKTSAYTAKYIQSKDIYDNERVREVGIIQNSIHLSLEKTNPENFIYIPLFRCKHKFDKWEITFDALYPIIYMKSSKCIQELIITIITEIKTIYASTKNHVKMPKINTDSQNINIYKHQRLRSELLGTLLYMQNVIDNTHVKIKTVAEEILKYIASWQGLLNDEASLPQYNHKQQYEFFKEILTRVKNLNQKSKMNSEKVVSFIQDEKQVYVAHLNENIVKGLETQYIIACESQENETDWQAFTREIKVNFKNDIQSIVIHFLSGICLNRILNDNQHNQSKNFIAPNTCYLKLELTKEQQQQILEEKNIAVFKPGKYHNIKICLLISGKNIY